MNFLLDTHIWLWSLLEPNKLGNRLQRELQEPGNEQWLSPISVWEATVLQRKGRLLIAGNAVDWFERSLGGLHEAPLTHEIALLAEKLPLHGDPADRFLAATAKVLGLTLVTADERLLGLGEIATLANR
ncbi:MAG TPA: type II toxin-antitoxin system VapC family toxin [Candidatus Angelobacter sp.]|nr:type II toxin-antitoxin system VapC family toxin [Candidatus Angelobacter sp.]